MLKAACPSASIEEGGARRAGKGSNSAWATATERHSAEANRTRSRLTRVPQQAVRVACLPATAGTNDAWAGAEEKGDKQTRAFRGQQTWTSQWGAKRKCSAGSSHLRGASKENNGKRTADVIGKWGQHNFKHTYAIHVYSRLTNSHSQIDDKQRDLLLHTERISELEQKLEKRIGDQNELEKRLRKEVETLQLRNCELETKLVDAASMASDWQWMNS